MIPVVIGMRLLRASLIAISLCCSSSAEAGGIDVDAWLGRPGVKLLAVEFYATWCKPCMEAVPTWKALHERYRNDGLRLVVVATQDPKGGCVNPGWSPDDVICDDDGRLAERFGAGRLPAAFLWTWQGRLLVNGGHVADVERQIRSWMQEMPRLEVEVGSVPSNSGITAQELMNLTRNQVRNQDKLYVVATAAERSRLNEIKRRSFAAGYDRSMQCKVGFDLSANSLLRASITGSRRLQLNLLSAERGCLVASSVVSWLPNKPVVSIAEATTELLQKLKRKTQWPWKMSRTAKKNLDPYEALGNEVEEVRRKAERDREKVNRAWSHVKKFASTNAIAEKRRRKALERFLSDFPENNPYKKEAEVILARLTPRSTDADGDGILDERDRCPNHPEDRDNFEDLDGCPDVDNDKDGILDTMDKCPLSPETINGIEDTDGCPESRPERKRVIATDRKLEITQKIRFRTGTNKVLRTSFPVLNEVVAYLKANPTIRIRVEGHTDSRGSARHNKRLSKKRANAVRDYLVLMGIASSRLEARGYGEEIPIMENRNPKGRAANRRIEFHIITR